MRDSIEDVNKRVEDVESSMECSIEELKGEFHGAMNQSHKTLTMEHEVLKAQYQALTDKVETILKELAACKAAMRDGLVGAAPLQKVDAPKPSTFKGSRSARQRRRELLMGHGAILSLHGYCGRGQEGKHRFLISW